MLLTIRHCVRAGGRCLTFRSWSPRAERRGPIKLRPPLRPAPPQLAVGGRWRREGRPAKFGPRLQTPPLSKMYPPMGGSKVHIHMLGIWSWRAVLADKATKWGMRNGDSGIYCCETVQDYAYLSAFEFVVEGRKFTILNCRGIKPRIQNYGIFTKNS
jgi:hypothetical protein